MTNMVDTYIVQPDWIFIRPANTGSFIVYVY